VDYNPEFFVWYNDFKYEAKLTNGKRTSNIGFTIVYYYLNNNKTDGQRYILSRQGTRYAVLRIQSLLPPFAAISSSGILDNVNDRLI